MWGSTETMVKHMAEVLASEGVEVVVHDLAVTDVGDLVDSRAMALGAPTVLGGAHPLAVYATYLFKALRPPTKFAVLLSSYGWAEVQCSKFKKFSRISKSKSSACWRSMDRRPART